MRILENPNPIEEQILTCEKCSCRFAYNKADIKEKSWNNGVLGPGNAGYYKEWIECPNCGQIHYIVNESHDHMDIPFDISPIRVLPLDLTPVEITPEEISGVELLLKEGKRNREVENEFNKVRGKI